MHSLHKTTLGLMLLFNPLIALCMDNHSKQNHEISITTPHNPQQPPVYFLDDETEDEIIADLQQTISKISRIPNKIYALLFGITKEQTPPV